MGRATLKVAFPTIVSLGLLVLGLGSIGGLFSCSRSVAPAQTNLHVTVVPSASVSAATSAKKRMAAPESLPTLVMQASEAAIANNEPEVRVGQFTHHYSPDKQLVELSSFRPRSRRIDLQTGKYLDRDNEYVMLGWLAANHQALVRRDRASIAEDSENDGAPGVRTFVLDDQGYHNVVDEPHEGNPNGGTFTRLAKESQSVVSVRENGKNRAVFVWDSSRIKKYPLGIGDTLVSTRGRWLSAKGDLLVMKNEKQNVVIYRINPALEKLEQRLEIKPTFAVNRADFSLRGDLLLLASTAPPYNTLVYDCSLSVPKLLSSHSFKPDETLVTRDLVVGPVVWDDSSDTISFEKPNEETQYVDPKTFSRTTQRGELRPETMGGYKIIERCKGNKCSFFTSATKKRSDSNIMLESIDEDDRFTSSWAGDNPFLIINQTHLNGSHILSAKSGRIDLHLSTGGLQCEAGKTECTYVENTGDFLAIQFPELTKRSLLSTRRRWRIDSLSFEGETPIVGTHISLQNDEDDDVTKSKDKSVRLLWRARATGGWSKPAQDDASKQNETPAFFRAKRCDEKDNVGANSYSCLRSPSLKTMIYWDEEGNAKKRSASAKTDETLPTNWASPAGYFLFSTNDRFLASIENHQVMLWDLDSTTLLGTWGSAAFDAPRGFLLSREPMLAVLVDGRVKLFRADNEDSLEIMLLSGSDGEVLPLVRDRAGYVEGPMQSVAAVSYRIKTGQGVSIRNVEETAQITGKKVRQQGMLERFFTGQQVVVE